MRLLTCALLALSGTAAANEKFVHIDFEGAFPPEVHSSVLNGHWKLTSQCDPTGSCLALGGTRAQYLYSACAYDDGQASSGNLSLAIEFPKGVDRVTFCHAKHTEVDGVHDLAWIQINNTWVDMAVANTGGSPHAPNTQMVTQGIVPPRGRGPEPEGVDGGTRAGPGA